jgi:hypothetical protein
MTTNEKRIKEFEDWLEEGDVPLPKEPADLELATEALRLAFNAGWNARKKQEYMQ